MTILDDPNLEWVTLRQPWRTRPTLAKAVKVLDIIPMRDCGILAIVQWNHSDLPKNGSQMRRPEDGSYWTIVGVESRCMSHRRGDRIGMLFRFETTIQTGDVIETVACKEGEP